MGPSSACNGRASRCAAAPLAALSIALAVVAVCSGCGGSSPQTTVTSAAPAPLQTPAGSETIVTVAQMSITKSAYEHWLAVVDALSPSKAHGRSASGASARQTLGFLISSDWVLGEAANLGITASDAEARQRLAQLKGKQFPKAAAFGAYLAKSHQSTADILQRVKVELLEAKISQHVMAGKTAATETHTLLADFEQGFEARWRSKTSCAAGYVMEDCEQYKGPPHPPARSASAQSSQSSSQSASAQNTVNRTGEVYSRPGKLSLASPAFERNGTIPIDYTCDGRDISPPLQWQNVPAHTAEFVLFMIGEGNGPNGGIRWVVAGLNPSLHEIKAGELPSGAIVGTNSSGKAAYGGACPAKGQTESYEFVLWALSKTISLSSGFTPAVAEHDYSGSELASAVTYATYTRG